MVSFRGQIKPEPLPDWSPLGVKFKFSDEHPRLFHMGVPPGSFSQQGQQHRAKTRLKRPRIAPKSQ